MVKVSDFFEITVYYTGPKDQLMTWKTFVQELLQDKLEEDIIDGAKVKILECKVTQGGEITIGPFPNGLSEPPKDCSDLCWQLSVFKLVLSVNLPEKPGFIPASQLWAMRNVSNLN